jgi:hypothetical protein
MRDRQTCKDCHRISPETETNYTLISAQFGWRLTRQLQPDGSYAVEWRCPECWRDRKNRPRSVGAPAAPSSAPPRNAASFSPPPLPSAPPLPSVPATRSGLPVRGPAMTTTFNLRRALEALEHEVSRAPSSSVRPTATVEEAGAESDAHVPAREGRATRDTDPSHVGRAARTGKGPGRPRG